MGLMGSRYYPALKRRAISDCPGGTKQEVQICSVNSQSGRIGEICASSVDICGQIWGNSVNPGELVHNQTPKTHPGLHPTDIQGTSGGWRNLSYAAAMDLHPQSTGLITITIQIKHVKQKQEGNLW